jgi:hypothetical protein
MTAESGQKKTHRPESMKQELPTKWLTLPPLVPLAIMASVAVVELAGHKWNIHGDLAAVLFAFSVSCVFAFVATSIALWATLKRLIESPPLRTRLNLAAAAFGGIWAITSVICLAVVIARIAAEG